MIIETNVLEKLATKYIDKRIFVSFEFNELGLIIRGYFNPRETTKISTFNRSYSYQYLGMTSADIDSLVDEFVKEFESNLYVGKEVVYVRK